MALFVTTNTVLMMLISSSRIIYGMAKDRALFTSFSKIYKKRNTPWLAIIITTLLSIIVIILSFNNISIVSKLAIFGIFIVFIFVNSSLIFLKFKKFSSLKQFLLNYKRLPKFAFMGIVISFIMILQFDSTTVLFSLIVISILFLISILFARSKNKKVRKI
jgi:basic amino acid/polyamine antiporter, APA family